MYLSPSLHPLFIIAAFVVAALLGTSFGALNYAVIMLTRDKMQDVLLVVFLLIVAAPTYYMPKVALPIAAAIAVLCVVPAMLERHMAGVSLFGWSYHLWRLWAATYQGIVLGICLTFYGAFFFPDIVPRPLTLVAYSVGGWLQLFSYDYPPIIPHPIEELIRTTFVLCLVLSPSAISVLRWMFHTSKLRPGVERLLSSSERLAEGTGSQP